MQASTRWPMFVVTSPAAFERRAAAPPPSGCVPSDNMAQFFKYTLARVPAPPAPLSPRTQMFATIFFSIISFYAKQAFNYGSTNNQRTARFLYHVRWITFSAQVKLLLVLRTFSWCTQVPNFFAPNSMRYICTLLRWNRSHERRSSYTCRSRVLEILVEKCFRLGRSPFAPVGFDTPSGRHCGRKMLQLPFLGNSRSCFAS